MLQVLKLVGLYLIGKVKIYTFSVNGKKSVLLSNYPLDEYQQDNVEGLIAPSYHQNVIFKKVRSAVGSPKGTVEQGKAFLKADDFMLKIDKTGEVVAVAK